MSWKVSFATKLLLYLFIITTSVSFFVLFLIPKEVLNSAKDEKVLGEEDEVKESIVFDETNNFQREIVYQEVSPDGDEEVIKYKLPFHHGLHNNYNDYLSSQFLVGVREIKSGREKYIAVSDYKSGKPHWLNNNYIYFTVYCGTACGGIQLVGTGGKTSKLAVLSYIYNSESERKETHLKDWFGKEFKFEGLVDEIESEMINGKAYLIFNRKHDSGEILSPKRFIFTQERLVESND